MASSIAFVIRMNIVSRPCLYTRSFGTRCMHPENAKAPAGELPPLELLRTFEAAARRLSFTLAAGELHLTQSAVSRQIAGLESHLGYALFQRQARGLSLTEEGRDWSLRVQQVFGLIGDALEQIGRRRDGDFLGMGCGGDQQRAGEQQG
eukprot:gene8109-10979_t